MFHSSGKEKKGGLPPAPDRVPPMHPDDVLLPTDKLARQPPALVKKNRPVSHCRDLRRPGRGVLYPTCKSYLEHTAQFPHQSFRSLQSPYYVRRKKHRRSALYLAPRQLEGSKTRNPVPSTGRGYVWASLQTRPIAVNNSLRECRRRVKPLKWRGHLPETANASSI